MTMAAPRDRGRTFPRRWIQLHRRSAWPLPGGL